LSLRCSVVVVAENAHIQLTGACYAFSCVHASTVWRIVPPRLQSSVWSCILYDIACILAN